MVDIDGDSDGSGPGARSRVTVMCSVRCMVRIGLQLELGSSPDVRAVARFEMPREAPAHSGCSVMDATVTLLLCAWPSYCPRVILKAL